MVVGAWGGVVVWMATDDTLLFPDLGPSGGPSRSGWAGWSFLRWRHSREVGLGRTVLGGGGTIIRPVVAWQERLNGTFQTQLGHYDLVCSYATSGLLQRRW